SSGCGLYNAQKNFVGNFNGGDLNGCTVANAFFGRLSISWTGGGQDSSSLKKWLDPKNLGLISLKGIEKPTSTVLNVESRTPSGKLLAHSALIQMTSAEGLVFSDSIYINSGQLTYRFPPYITSISITPKLDSSPKDGLSAADVVLIQKHILSVAQLNEPWKLIAADANNSGTISVADIVDIRKLILSVISALPKSPSWRFVIKNASPAPIFKDGKATYLSNGNPNYSIEFQGIKIGDVNRVY
ncbi:MAG: hypothetical protein ACOYOA_12895, partial [Saprospiraceae bacterium]